MTENQSIFENEIHEQKAVLKEVLWFIGLTFLVTFAMNYFMFLGIQYGLKDAAISFAVGQMGYPALMAGLLMWFRQPELVTGRTKVLVSLVMLNGIGSAGVLVYGVMARDAVSLSYVNVLAVGLSMVVVFLLLTDREDQLKASGLSPRGATAMMVKMLVIYFLLFLLTTLISSVLGLGVAQWDELIKVLPKAVLLLVPLSFLFSCIIFLGEEMGWRFYLQPRLQALMGKRLGVLLLGAVWGIWHAPLCFMLYSPKTPGLSVLYYVIFCSLVSIFFGYAYMKTGSVWTAVWMHLINNTIAGSMNPSYEMVLTWREVILTSVMLAVIYLPFLWTRVYRKTPLNDEKDSEVSASKSL